uniref:Glycosyltransferase n=1 Tax=Chenopodium quinoa TaxID=63459 RepID=A0A803M5N1_CHEQI
MENITNNPRAHILALPYPIQGHISPVLQFCRRLVSKGVKASLAITKHISTTINPKPDSYISLVTISDGYDDSGIAGAESAADYFARFEIVGSQALGDLIEENVSKHDHITCIVYDPFLPWGLNVAKKYGLFGAAFFTQPCGVNYIYYLTYHRKLLMPVSSPMVHIPGLPPLKVGDLPSFVSSPGSYPAFIEMVLNQYLNLDEADFVLVNTIYDLEEEIVDVMSKECPLLTIGPTVPSFYVDNRIPHDREYGLSLYHINPNIINWLSTKPPKSVIYVSFGSVASLTKTETEELAWGLKQSEHHFLWVVRASEEGKLPKGFAGEVAAKGLIVRWCPQLEVLSSEAIGCFFTHCGWNSTLEALVMGVPLIGMPQWTDQPMVSKFVEDVWKVGVRVKVSKEGGVRREEIVERIIEVMEEKKVELLKMVRNGSI